MTYSTEFFKNRREQTLASARPIVEHLWESIQPQSVLDVGCATGIWLAEAKKQGALDIKGIDGPWVPSEELEIEESSFLQHDLSKNNPSNVGSYDLAFCIEVAEHIAPDAADRFIDFLTSHSDAVLFSAAIPGQGGTDHINEQPQSYWHKKFNDRKFECFDIVRPNFWDDPKVNVIYKQNMLLYIRKGSEIYNVFGNETYNRLRVTEKFHLDRVHPYLFKLRTESNENNLFKRIIKKLINFIRR